MQENAIRQAVEALGFQVNLAERRGLRLMLTVVEPLRWSFDDLHRAYRSLTERFGRRYATEFALSRLVFIDTEPWKGD